MRLTAATRASRSPFRARDAGLARDELPLHVVHVVRVDASVREVVIHQVDRGLPWQDGRGTTLSSHRAHAANIPANISNNLGLRYPGEYLGLRLIVIIERARARRTDVANVRLAVVRDRAGEMVEVRRREFVRLEQLVRRGALNAALLERRAHISRGIRASRVDVVSAPVIRAGADSVVSGGGGGGGCCSLM